MTGRQDARMFIVLLEYLADLSEIDALLEDHVDWLDENYAAGLFLASGRREPRTGGVILAVGDRSAVAAAIARDPFAIHGVAQHELIEFHPSAFGGPLDTDVFREALG